MFDFLIIILGIIGLLFTYSLLAFLKNTDCVSFSLFRFRESKDESFFDFCLLEIDDWDGSVFGLWRDLESKKPRWIVDILFMRFGDENEEESEVS